jgi:ubiquinone/menaquinone biosynthesis C-methylase UbiE
LTLGTPDLKCAFIVSTLSSRAFSTADAERTARFYDALHIHYEKVGVFSEQNPHVTSFGVLRDRIAALNLGEKIKDAVVLDAGCGAWQKGVRILRQFEPQRIEAVDINERSLAHCRDDAQTNTRYSCQDLQSLAFGDETFDFIVCEGVAHHTLRPERTLSELVRVLKKGGVLTLGLYCWRFPYTFVSEVLRRTVGRKWDFAGFLAISGRSKPLLLFADFIFVPVEHAMKEKEVLKFLASIGCRVVFNDNMGWPLPILNSRSKTLFRLAGIDYRHIFVVKGA